MVVTSVTGHLTDNDFPEPYNKGWSLCDPLELFTMEIKTFVPEVRVLEGVLTVVAKDGYSQKLGTRGS